MRTSTRNAIKRRRHFRYQSSDKVLETEERRSILPPGLVPQAKADYDKAIDDYNEAAKIDPSDTRIFRQRARGLREHGEARFGGRGSRPRQARYGRGFDRTR